MSTKTDEFLKKYAPIAQALERATFGAIPASLTLGQAALESGWGTSAAALKDNNPFGIKGTGDAGTSWLASAEYENGSWGVRTSGFAKYSSLETSFSNYAKVLSNQRYYNAFNTTDSTQMVKAIADAGYATDPEYASKVTSIINTYNLKKYDGSVDIKDVKIDGNKILEAANASGNRQTVVESVFGNPNEGEDWSKNAHDRENALNPPTDPAAVGKAMTDAVTEPFKKALLGGTKLVIIIVLVVILAALIFVMVPKPSAATVAKAVL